MGLDMYLWKAKTPRDMGGTNPRTMEELKNYDDAANTPAQKARILDGILSGDLFVKGEYSHWVSPFADVGYWRKANHIHKWFVDNVQGGNDDCGIYPVTFDQLAALRAACQLVVETAKIESGMIENGKKLEGGKWVPCMEEGGTITNPEEIAKILPTQEGFFFGGTGYDQYYMSDVKATLAILEKIPAPDEHGSRGMTYFYSSSW